MGLHGSNVDLYCSLEGLHGSRVVLHMRGCASVIQRIKKCPTGSSYNNDSCPGDDADAYDGVMKA